MATNETVLSGTHAQLDNIVEDTWRRCDAYVPLALMLVVTATPTQQRPGYGATVYSS